MWEGEQHEVTIRASEANRDFRRHCAMNKINAGSTKFGSHASKNQGVSVLREGREIALDHSFVVSYDPVERFWGIEVSFSRGLDDFFGVTNNKQAATAFKALTIHNLADEEEISVADLKKDLKSSDDPRYGMLSISEEIHDLLEIIRKNLENQTRGTRLVKSVEEEEDNAVDDAARKTVEGDGKTGVSDDKDQNTSEAEKKKELSKELDKDGGDLTLEDKQAILAKWLESKFIFQTSNFRGSDYIFDVSQPAGKIKVDFNSEHLVYQRFIQPIEQEDGAAFDLLKLLFAAFARTEDILKKGNREMAKELEDIRKLWGVTANSMIDNYDY